MFGIPRGIGIATPQAEMPSSCQEGEAHEQAGVVAAPVVVEVRRGGTDAHEQDAHVEAAAGANDVAKQSPVAIHGVRLRLGSSALQCQAAEGAS